LSRRHYFAMPPLMPYADIAADDISPLFRSLLMPPLIFRFRHMPATLPLFSLMPFHLMPLRHVSPCHDFHADFIIIIFASLRHYIAIIDARYFLRHAAYCHFAMMPFFAVLSLTLFHYFAAIFIFAVFIFATFSRY
jgi:hypothetical protein